MFYGYYTKTITKTCEAAHLYCSSAAESPVTDKSQTMAYSISTAYFFTTIVTFFIICIILVYRLDDE